MVRVEDYGEDYKSYTILLIQKKIIKLSIMRKYILVLLVSMDLLGCTSLRSNKSATNSVEAEALTPYGRTAITDHKLELIGSASHAGFSFEGKTCSLYVSLTDWQDHNYIQYELDGVYQKRIRIEKNAAQPFVLTVATDGKHTVWIYKATEAHTGPVFIEKITGQGIRPIKKAALPAIEFIGNSITCGAAADASEVPCGTGVYHDQHNAYYAYGPRMARALNVEYTMSSVSGIGIYRNWNSDGPTMPQVYEKTDFQDKSGRMWNFNTYKPKVVSIALGTNDYSNGDGIKKRLPFDSAVFVSTYIQFVRLVKSKYPAAQIALLSSPMINGSRRITLQNCLLAVKTAVDRSYPSAKPVAIYFFKPMQARGCTGHPNVEDHAILAEEVIPFFRGLLK